MGYVYFGNVEVMLMRYREYVCDMCVTRMENKATKMLLRQKNFGIRSDQMLQGH